MFRFKIDRSVKWKKSAKERKSAFLCPEKTTPFRYPCAVVDYVILLLTTELMLKINAA